MKGLLETILWPVNYLKKRLQSIGDFFPHHATSDEIALIMNTNLFRKLSDDEMAQLVSSIHVKTYAAGDLILQEGESGNELYIIADGTARVFITDEAQNKIQLKELNPGNYFGELAPSGRKFKIRNASIEAVSNIKLIGIHGKFLHELLKSDNSFKSLIEERKVNQSMNIVAHASIFKNEIETLLANLEDPRVLEFNNKECIFAAGDKADNVYLVIQGKVKLLIPHKDNDSISELVINKGHLFGELGVMQNAPRAATAIADGSLLLLAINGEDFKKDATLSASFTNKLAMLQRMYTLPLRGIVEQYSKAIPHDGISIMGRYKLEDGRIVHSSTILDKDEFNMWCDDNAKAEVVHYAKDNNHVELFVHNHHLIRIKANSTYAALPELCFKLLDNVKIADEDIALFKSTGKLTEPAAG